MEFESPHLHQQRQVTDLPLCFPEASSRRLIAVILRRLGRKYGLADRSSGDPAQEPDYRRWA